MKRRLTNVDVEFISLVGKGANKKTILWKSASPAAHAARFERHIEILKTDEEKRLVYGIVYAPDEVDTQGDMMTAADVEKMAHAFLKAARTQQVDKDHDGDPDDGAVVESWIVRKGDALFPETEGAWAVAIKVLNDDTWEQVKKGELTGLSMAGTAETEELEKSMKTIVEKIMAAVRAKFGVQKDFNDELLRQKVWPVMDALSSAIYMILGDDTISDKKGAIAESVEQMKAQFTTQKSAGAEPPEGDPMKKEEILAVIQETVPGMIEKAVGAITTSVETLTKTVTDGLKAVGERVETVEKSSAGRQSTAGDDDETRKAAFGKGNPDEQVVI